jgi:hypothetical protein
MSLPGFTAAASLNGVNRRYRMAGTNFTSEGGERVVPQLGTTMEDWWAEWTADGGGGGGSGTLAQCEILANQTKNACLGACGFWGGTDFCRNNCVNNWMRDLATCRR